MNVKIILFSIITLVSTTAMSSFKPNSISKIANLPSGINLWYEAYGDKNDPAVLLIMGAGCQGIFWSENFCQKLSDFGYYVIRYDHRDTGLSSKVDYAKDPYDLKDLKQDAINLLEHIDIKQAHIVGMSMGGVIAQYLAIENPELTNSITLISSTSVYRDIVSKLPSPENSYVNRINKILFDKDNKEPIKQCVDLYEAACNQADFDYEYWHDLCEMSLSRSGYSQNYLNHIPAQDKVTENRVPLIKTAKTPALVIQGAHDPIFPKQHGQSLAETLNADYYQIDKMGHMIAPQQVDIIASLITNLIQNS